MGFSLGQAIGAVASPIAAAGAIYAGNKAASASRGASNEAYDSLNASKGEVLGRLDPYSNYGQQAMIPLSALLYGKNYDPSSGQFTGDISQADRFNSFQQSPGYQYQLDQGLKAVERRNAATGTLLGGNTQKELSDYGQQTANQGYNDYINQLMGQLQVGQNADTNAANVIQGLGGQMAGYQYAGGMANAQKYSNLSNFLFNLSGQGFGAATDSGGSSGGMNGGGSGGGSGTGFVPAGAGMYNTSYFNNAGASAMSPYTLR